ncbi:MAG: carbon starvation CstA family protein [Kiritimatiellia bacterium]
MACGIISGFHATQSPIVARTIQSEREARATFYGMMIAEGVIAMIWAAAALAMYNLAPENLHLAPAEVLGEITRHFLGPWMGGVTVLGVVVLAITSGDTALRSTRLSLSEMLHVPQAKFSARLSITLPLMVVVSALLWWSNQSAKSFSHLWNYFAWGNQVLSASTLMACTVWMLSEGRKAAATAALIPGMFMTSVVACFILWTSSDKGQPVGLVPGGMPLPAAIGVAVVVAFVFAAYVFRRGRGMASDAGGTPPSICPPEP